MTTEKSIVSQLEKSYTRALDIYKTRGLHMRTRNVADIENRNEKIHETLRHNLIRYELIEMNRNVRRLIRRSAKSDSLLKLYDEIDLRRENWTNANIFEKRYDNLLKIIDIVKGDPEKFFSNQSTSTKNIIYSQSSGIITQGNNTFTIKNDAKKLIDYLWGKRRQTYLDKTPDKCGRQIKRNSVIANCNIIDNKLTNIIDNFNNQMKKPERKIDAYIRRKDGLIQLEVIDEFSTSK